MAADHLGIDRDGLNFRAGWVEALKAFGVRLQVVGMCCPKKEIPGLEKASQVAQEMHKEMLDKMRNAGEDSSTTTEEETGK